MATADANLTDAQKAWLKAHPGFTIVTARRHAGDYARASNGKGPWMGDILLCGDGSELPGTSYPLDNGRPGGRAYARPPKKQRRCTFPPGWVCQTCGEDLAVTGERHRCP